MTNLTRYENEGNPPIVTERFNTVTSYSYTTMSGQMDSVAGYRFVLLANPGNSNNVLVGSIGEITFPMEAGFGISLDIENLNQLYANIQAGDILHLMVLSEV